jgi:hypothetical protein
MKTAVSLDVAIGYKCVKDGNPSAIILTLLTVKAVKGLPITIIPTPLRYQTPQITLEEPRS